MEIERFEFRPLRNDFHVTFKLLKPEDLAPKQAGVKPAAAPGTSSLQAALQELSSKIEAANTARALTDLASPLKRASSRFSAAQIRPAIDKWVTKSADMVGFYLDAHSALGWTQAALRQYEDMSELATQLNLLQPRPETGEPRKWKLPAQGHSNLAKLPLVQWTREQVAAEQGRAAAERAARAEAEKLKKNPFYDRRNFDELLAACGTPGIASLAEWLEYLTADDSGRTFLQQYPAWKIINSARPSAIKEVIESFKAVLRTYSLRTNSE